ncbi:unnamed protein product [Camellia sinensis]
MGDVTRKQDVQKVLHGADCVFHLASYGMSGKEMLQFGRVDDVNINGTCHVLEACVEHGVMRLVYVSTYNVVFGGKEIINGNETLPYFPLDDYVDPYSRSKCIAEQLVLKSNERPLKKKNGNLYTCAIRPVCCHSKLVKKVKSDRVYIDNLVLALILASMGLLDDIPQREGRPIAAGQPYFISDVHEVGVTHYFSFLKAKEELGYVPMVSPQEGMAATISYFQERKMRSLDGPTIYTWMFSVIGMTLLFIAAYWPAFGPVSLLRDFCLFFFRSMWVMRMVFILATAAHIGEAMYAWHLAKKVDPLNASGWFWLLSLRFLLKRARKVELFSKDLVIEVANQQCVQSSKKAAKRHRKEQEAIVVATMDNRSDGPIRISDLGSNTRQTESPNANGVADSSQQLKKKTRGPSKLKMHDKGKQKCDEIDFNERNQPIGQESVHLSTLEGVLARKMVPINIDYWFEVPDEIKDKLWNCVKLKYKVHDIHKTHVMQKFAKLWRNYKSELSRKVRTLAAAGKGHLARNIALTKPDKIGMDEWKAFVKNRLSKSFIEKSEKFKEMRAKQKVLHTLSRKGYARLEEDMNKVQELHKPSTEEGSMSIKNDAIVQAFGPERRGSVRGLGFGALPSKVDAAYQNQNVRQLNEKLLLLEQELREIKAEMSPAKGQMDTHMEKLRARKMVEMNIGCMEVGDENNEDDEDIWLHDTNETGNGGSMDNAKCKLLNWDGTKVVVAEGTIASTDSKALVHHVPLGPGCWKITKFGNINMDPAVVLTGTANERRVGHHFGSVEIGRSESAYIFRVALPGARRNGSDVSSKIMSFSQNGPRAVCILSANGGMSNVTLRQVATSGGTATYEGRFDILSLCGSFLLTEVGGSMEPNWWVECHISWTRWTCFRWLCCRTSYCCNPCSAGPASPFDEKKLAMLQNDATHSQLIMGSFIADGGKESKAVNQMEQLSAPSKLFPVGGGGGGAAGATSPPSHGPLSESSDGPGSPLNHSTGAYNNSNPQGMLTMPWR